MKEPLVSFCIATLGREVFIKKALEAIFAQSYKNFEVVISDNDSRGQLDSIIAKFDCSKITYHVNSSNIGMMANFRKAYSLSKGELICCMADDDPPEPCMLSTLIEAYQLHPDAVMYYGGTVINIESEYYAKLLSLNFGRNEPDLTRLEKDVNIYSSFDFTKSLFEGGLCCSIWSSGLAKREYIDMIGGIPDYGSGYFADIAYLLGLASKGDVVLVKKAVGSWSRHQESETTNLHQSDRKKLQEWLDAASNYYRLSVNFLENGCSESLLPLKEVMQDSLARCIIGMIQDRKNNVSQLKQSDYIEIFNYGRKVLPFLSQYELMFLYSMNLPKVPNSFKEISRKLPASIRTSKLLRSSFLKAFGFFLR